jgi:radical SAM superfamily enzyme YgiQ (UPF0313 family)
MASRQTVMSQRQLAAAETRLGEGWTDSGRLRVCLLYPNTYAIGMSSLAVHALYSLLNRLDDFYCERAFLPSQTEVAELQRRRRPLCSIESEMPLGGFDLVAVTTSFELDWLNLPLCLQLGGVPPLQCEREPQSPFVVGGGPCFTANPSPVLDMFDAVFVGEAEPVLPQIQQLINLSRDEWGEYLSQWPGFIVPGLSQHPAPRRCARNLDEFATDTVIVTEHTEFASSYLVEMGRGCGRGCSFCLAGKIYRPVRYRRPQALLGRIMDAMAYTDRVGLVAASVSDYPWLEELCAGLSVMEPRPHVSASSVRADGDNQCLFELQATSGQHSVTFAPETGTERLRQTVCKHLSDEQLHAGIRSAVEAGLDRVKLYFLLGLPGETAEDRAAIVTLVRELASEYAQCSWSISVNPFVPKPHTALQAAETPDIATTREHLAELSAALDTLPRVRTRTGSARWSAVQTAISRGDARLGKALVTAGTRQADFSQLRRILAEAGHDLTQAKRLAAAEGPYPWDIVSPACYDTAPGGD